jgi:hypothetical protein
MSLRALAAEVGTLELRVGGKGTTAPLQVSVLTSKACGLKTWISGLSGNYKSHDFRIFPPDSDIKGVILDYECGPDWNLHAASVAFKGNVEFFTVQRRTIVASEDDLILENGEPYVPKISNSIKNVFSGGVSPCIDGILEDVDRKLKTMRERVRFSNGIVRCKLNVGLRIYYAALWAEDNLDDLIEAVLRGDSRMMRFVDEHDFEVDYV